MKHTIALLLLALTPCLAQAQKKELSQARTYIKSKKNFDQAEKLMTGLLKDSANTTDARIYRVWFEAVKGQYDQANERMYLKQKQDTTAFFTLTRRMFSVAEALDSLEMMPDKKGNVNIQSRQKHAAMLNTYRPNLLNAGTYYIRKGQWDDAYTYLADYMDCARQPLFQAYGYDSTDTRMPEAAYWATYCGYRQQNPERTLAHHQLALDDSIHKPYTLQFVAEAYRWLHDDANYVATLQQGYHSFPLFPYFFPRLTDAYTSSGHYDKALALADSALLECDTCELFLFAKSTALLRLERWQESAGYSKILIQQNDSLPEPYFNAATAYINMAAALDPIKDKVLLRDYYQRARTYMEYYRQLMPGEEDKWAPALYRIYLNLNLGRQFDEIDWLLKSKK